MNTLSSIVTDDNAISVVLNSDDVFNLYQLVNAYHTALDREVFFCMLCTRLLFERTSTQAKNFYSSEKINPVV